MSSSTVTLFWKLTCTVISLLPTTTFAELANEARGVTPDTISSVSDVSVTMGLGASITSNMWNINVTTQQSSDLTIHLGPSWGFHPTYPSTIALFIDGSTSTQTLNGDGEILFIFSASDQYFAELVSIDKPKFAYKECPASASPLITTNITKMINSLSPERFYRFCKNEIGTNTPIDYWTNTVPTYKATAEWPMFVEIKNNPRTNTVEYIYGDFGGSPGQKLSSQFSSSFPTNVGFEIDISGESQYEMFNIGSIDISYHIHSTDSPTINPTVMPTMIPTINPTPNPSVNPTVTPTDNPTQTPTNNPSMFPTVAPTTYAPTTSQPSIMPTEVPSITPTMVPTTTPTMQPSTAQPSVSPTTSTTETPLEITPPPTASILTTAMEITDRMSRDSGELIISDIGWIDRLWYIIGVIVLALCCVCCVIVFIAGKRYNGKQGNDTVRRHTSTSLKKTKAKKSKVFDMNRKQKVWSNSMDVSDGNVCDEMGIENEMDTVAVGGDEKKTQLREHIRNSTHSQNEYINDVITEIEMNEFDPETTDSNVIHNDNGYEIGMVNVSKVSEMAYENVNNDNVNEESFSDDVETAGFIDGRSFNDLEYENEYYNGEIDI